MKFVVIGFHGSGKREIVDELEKLGIKCGKLFSNIDEDFISKENYMSDKYDLFSTEEVNSIFENNAYIFFKELEGYGYKYYEGLTKHEFEKNSVFIMSPDQYVHIPASVLQSENYTIIWLDNTKSNRYNNYLSENRSYNFNVREMIERKNIKPFLQYITSPGKNMIYFTNEDPIRVAVCLYMVIKYPETLPIYTQNFN